ncbi:MAG: hypothetical protein R3D62_12010 [Xanthobacteraceae bacterium]
MAKRSKPAGDADLSQNELDFEQSENGDGTIEAPAETGPSSQADRPRLEKRLGLNDRNRSDDAIPHMALPSLELNSAWKAAEDMPPHAAASMRSFRMRRIAALAATVALSAALGALAGSMLTNGLGSSMAARASNDEASTQLVLARMEQEVSALRAAVETSARDTQSKTTRIAERLERSERAQAEPLAKLAKIGEAVERLERRGAPATAAAKTAALPGDVTGSIGAPLPVAAPGTRPANVISGWTLKEVYNGVALIKGSAGLVEVWPGDNLPKIGRVLSIRKQDGRWIVVTTRGVIVDR